MKEDCTVYSTVDIVSKKWSLLIILSIHRSMNSSKRYNEIKKDLNNITPKILSLRLKELEMEGVIKRNIDNSHIPIKVYYSLTNSGKDLIKIIQDIKQWGLKWKKTSPRIRKICDKTMCKHCNI